MNTFRRLLFLAEIVVTILLPSLGLGNESPYSLQLEAFRTGNKQILAVLTLTPAHGVHAYGPLPGPSGFPTAVSGTANGKPVSALYPPPSPGPDPLDPSLTVHLYEGPTPFFIPLEPANLELRVRLDALLCSSTTCQPLREERELSLNATHYSALPEAEKQSWWALFLNASQDPAITPALPSANASEAETMTGSAPALAFKPRYFAPGLEVHTLSKAAILAFVAGLILNFMPCVLPVITLKLRSFIPVAGSIPSDQRRAFRAHNLFFALGMMLYFLVLAGIIAMTGMAWGQIFQQPSAIISLTAIVFALSLSLFGIYDLPLIDLKGKTGHGVVHHPQLESFTTGVLATVLATPCSGPFLGGVLAWALIQPSRIIALVLSCIGFGMASPYLVMALFPNLYRFLPRPGTWTVHLERILGFLLAGTCVYLFGLLPASEYLNVLILLWVIAMAAWMWGQWTNLNQGRRKRWSIRGAGIIMVVLTAVFLFRPSEHVDPWRPFEMDQFENLLGQKNLVLDFTADWCPNCKFLEKTVLTPEQSARLAEKHDAVLLRVDLTRHDPKLMHLLESLGSKSIPIVALFSKDDPGSPLVLRDLFTSGQFQDALEEEF